MSNILKFPNFGYKESPGNYVAGVWEQSGLTPIGKQRWTMKTNHQRDCEDNDTTYTLTLGSLEFAYAQDRGRDWHSDTTSITVTNPKTYQRFKISTTQGGGRSGAGEEKSEMEAKKEVVVAINACAAKEGMTAQQFVGALPHYFTSFAGSLYNNVAD